MLGVEAKIQSVNVPDKGLVHRVRVGPLSRQDDIDRVKAQLKQDGINATLEERTGSLKSFVSLHGLPPPQILFMEVQMEGRSGTVQEISVIEAAQLIKQKPALSILDVRENWELKMGSIPKAMPLTAELLDDILQKWEKEEPLLLYCHFGVRSLDAASFLADRGFKNVLILKGGIDSWSTEIDPTIPRYEGAYC